MGAAGTPLTTGDKALLTIDVWEHAYYIDYRNLRPKFVETFLNNLVNWDVRRSQLRLIVLTIKPEAPPSGRLFRLPVAQFAQLAVQPVADILHLGHADAMRHLVGVPFRLHAQRLQQGQRLTAEIDRHHIVHAAMRGEDRDSTTGRIEVIPQQLRGRYIRWTKPTDRPGAWNGSAH